MAAPMMMAPAMAQQSQGMGTGGTIAVIVVGGAVVIGGGYFLLKGGVLEGAGDLLQLPGKLLDGAMGLVGGAVGAVGGVIGAPGQGGVVGGLDEFLFKGEGSTIDKLLFGGKPASQGGGVVGAVGGLFDGIFGGGHAPGGNKADPKKAQSSSRPGIFPAIGQSLASPFVALGGLFG